MTSRPGTAGAQADSTAIPVNLELVTLTEDSAVLTWYTGAPGTDDGLGRMIPVPTNGEVWFGTRPDRLDRRVVAEGSTPYHHIELTGLEPGRAYYYRAVSQGRSATPTFLAAGHAAGLPTPTPGVHSFTTPQPPPGRFLFSIALCNDLHLGETVAGSIGQLPWVQGISQVSGRPPYPEIMTRALVTDAQARGASYLLAAGDITAEAEPIELGNAKRLLDGFGRYQRDYFVARGNHDRAHEGRAWQACTPGRWQGNDCYHDVFGDQTQPAYFEHDVHGLRIMGIDTYDKPGDGGDSGAMSSEQFAWFRHRLSRDRDRPTLVFGHHPLITPDAPQAITGGTSLAAQQASEVLATYARTPGVFLHHAGHTHRNKRTALPGAPAVTQQEVAAVKEYPGGFTLLRVHSGGYAVNFYKTRAPLAREWSERSRQELASTWPQLSLGNSVSDRNSVAARDLSGIGRPV
ncbi:metallophosphoesterase family protein [Gordonia sp. PKS22-38]|uniref:Metallophosphoesterase family protein n=1 Tax=Gordonia prachuapensis TaxID=3115651 RepID=A0ABU7MZU8_9ACTN|nr:metallophosphoesterase family protein [Gordonia sp. PKS22-38]